MRYRQFLSVLVLTAFVGQAQELVPNGDFEAHSALPATPGEWYVCNGWSSVVNVGGPFPYYPAASPDYFHTNGGFGAQLPNTFAGMVMPHSGQAAMGLVTLMTTALDDYREYISVELAQPLVPGTTYALSLYLTNGQQPAYGMATSGFGAAFTVGPLAQTDHEPIAFSPQFMQTAPFWSTSWQLVTFQFTATDACDHLTLGVFQDDATASIVDQAPSALDDGYLFIDDVSLQAITTVLPPVAAFTFTLQAGCRTTQLSLQNTSSANALSHAWSFPGADISSSTAALPPTISYAAPDTYFVSLVACNSAGCDTATATIVVELPQGPVVDLGDDRSICAGTTALLSVPPFASVTWYRGHVRLPDDDTALLATEPDEYIVVVVDELGCTASDTVRVMESPIPVLDLGPDLVMCPGVPVRLTAPGNFDTYQWSTGAITSEIVVARPGSYALVTSHPCGSLSDSVAVVTHGGDLEVFIPNVFTPNADGINDLFAPIGEDGGAHAFSIYDRWGLLLYSGEKASASWDGTSHGSAVPDGVYVYVVQVQDGCQAHGGRTGHVTLLR